VFQLTDPGFERVLYAAGNHDIGFHNVTSDVFGRHVKYFGNTSYRVSLMNQHNLVVLDTISLSNQQSPGFDLATEILEEMSQKKNRSVILVTHVPLYREQPCQGSLSDRQIIPGWGYQYQTMLTNELSQRILRKLTPSLVLSGDDHHNCMIRHKLGDEEVIEVELPA
jgi:hypothetical protein